MKALRKVPLLATFLAVSAVLAGCGGGGASGGDAAAGSGGSAGGNDGAAGSGGATGTGGAGGTGGATGSGGAAGMFVEPNCTETGEPTWTLVDAMIPELKTEALGLTGVAYGNGLFVAVAAGNMVDKLMWITSEDGRTWTKHTQSLGAGVKHITLLKVHYMQGKFVFFGRHMGDGGYVYTSSDALTWTVTQIEKDALASVEEFDSSGTLAAQVGGIGSIRTSTDLLTWTTGLIVSGTFDSLDIAFGGGRWVASINVGDSIYTSADAITWTPVKIGAHYTIEYGRGIWAVNGTDYYTSTDGITFDKTPKNGLGSGGHGRFQGGRFMYLSGGIEGTMIRKWYDASTDGKTYTVFGKLPIGAPDPINHDLVYGRCHYVAAGFIAPLGVRAPYILVGDAAPAP